MSVQKKEKATWEMLDRFFLRVLGEKDHQQPQQHQGQQHIRQKNCGGGQSGSFLFHGGYLISQSDF